MFLRRKINYTLILRIYCFRTLPILVNLLARDWKTSESKVWLLIEKQDKEKGIEKEKKERREMRGDKEYEKNRISHVVYVSLFFLQSFLLFLYLFWKEDRVSFTSSSYHLLSFCCCKLCDMNKWRLSHRRTRLEKNFWRFERQSRCFFETVRVIQLKLKIHVKERGKRCWDRIYRLSSHSSLKRVPRDSHKYLERKSRNLWLLSSTFILSLCSQDEK